MESSNAQNNAYAKGLEGVIAAETEIGFVDGQEGRLVYRGYDISVLSENSNYEEISYLLNFGKLPNRKQMTEYLEQMRANSEVPQDTYDLIQAYGKKAHPMVTLRTVVSNLASYDPKESDSSIENQKRIAISIIAKMPAIVGAIHRTILGKDIMKSRSELSYAGSFLYYALGRNPDPVETKIMDTALMLHADHGMNASTFSALVTISTLADIYSATTSAISTLKGPLHGGANERALKMIMDIGSPEKAGPYLEAMVARKEKIMGFGHRVYKVYDPRAKILKKYASYISEKSDRKSIFETANKVEEIMINKLGEKGIFPNVDFYSGMIYYSMGLTPEIFTPIFALGRISGWTARSLEYLQDNKLFRPKALYVGERGPKTYTSIQERQ
ncbi:MAG: citrate/2-methylcitrate synthase [Thermoplasmataceae archaeon]